VVGHATGVLNATTSISWRFGAATAIAAPSWLWKLFH
jgi:hypothetical protein